MELRVTHRTIGSEAYLLQRDGEVTLLYNRILEELDEIEIPALFVGRVSWLPFDGDPEPVIDEVRALLERGKGAN